MIIKTHIIFREYLKLLFGLAYRRPIMKIILLVDLALILWITGYYLHFLPVPEPKIYQYITLVLISIVQPMVIYLTIKRNYKSSNHFREKLEIEFTPSLIKISGQSFYTEIKWEKLFKIDEQTNWYLVYQNNFSAILIPKKSFHGEEQEKFRKIILAIQNVPVNLKNN